MFNAIAQSKRESIEQGEALSLSKQKVQREENISDIKEMTQSNLIDLLTSSGGNHRNDAKNKRKSLGDMEMNGSKDHTKPDDDQTTKSSSKWNALDDNYLMNKSNSLKKWDNVLNSSSSDSEKSDHSQQVSDEDSD